MSGGGVTVHGGASGTDAKYDDMQAAARMFSNAAGQIEHVLDECTWVTFVLEGSPFGPDLLGAAIAQHALKESLSRARDVQERLKFIAVLLHSAVERYRHGDHSILGRLEMADAEIWGATLSFGSALLHSTSTYESKGALAGAEKMATEDPQLVDAAANVLQVAAQHPGGAGAVLRWIALMYFDDGAPVVTGLGPDPSAPAGLPPRGLAGLMQALRARNRTRAGEIDVRILHAPGAKRHVIVDIPGTKDWSVVHETRNAVGWATNIRAINGTRTTYEQGVLEAMKRAGVKPDDDVMVVGHSLGGMIATAVARDGGRSGAFNVTHVLTAGAPIGTFVGQLPKRVQVLALENKHDVVPHLDGADNPDLANVTTVGFNIDTGSAGGNHGIDTAYEHGAAEVDVSDDPAIRAFLHSADGYFDADSARTMRFMVTRK